MTKRVDRETLLCKAHDVHGCQMCMVDDFYDALAAAIEKRRQLKAERKSICVNDRFDLGGES